MKPALSSIHGLDAAKVMARALDAPPLPWAMQNWQPPSAQELTQQLTGYTVETMIDRGGMGAVYRARQESLARQVAIKVLPPEAGLVEGFAIRFQNEARLLAKLQHPNIVAVHDSGETTDGHLYLILELVEGSNLTQRIQPSQPPENRLLSPQRALEIFTSVLAGLAHAHEHGVIHRDIKPSNVLIAQDGTVKVADFGLAKGPDAPAPGTATITGTVFGTPDYMSPEQRRGQPVDHRTDIYSLGVLLYEMLTADMPRGAWQPASKLARVDKHIDSIISKALQPEPADRYQSVKEMQKAVASAMAGKLSHILDADLGVFGWLLSPLRLVPSLLVLVVLFEMYSVYARKGNTNSPVHDVAPAPSPLPASPQAPTPKPSPVPAVTSAVKPKPRTTPISPSPFTPNSQTQIFPLFELPAALEGKSWEWEHDEDHQVLQIASFDPGPVREVERLPLPFQLTDATYNLQFEVCLLRTQSDLMVILPAGKTQFCFSLNLWDVTSIGPIDGVWRNNLTSVKKTLTTDVWHPIFVMVRLLPEQIVKVKILVDEEVWIDWEGPADSLSLPRDGRIGWPIKNPGGFGLSTYRGGLKIHQMRLWLE